MAGLIEETKNPSPCLNPSVYFPKSCHHIAPSLFLHHCIDFYHTPTCECTTTLQASELCMFFIINYFHLNIASTARSSSSATLSVAGTASAEGWRPMLASPLSLGSTDLLLVARPARWCWCCVFWLCPNSRLGEMYIVQGGFFNCSSQFSAPKWQMMGSKSGILFHEILDHPCQFNNVFLLALKFGRNS